LQNHGRRSLYIKSIAAIKNYFGRYWFLKILSFPIFLLLSVFHYPYLYFFYRREIKNITARQQVFFQAREEYGAILELLYYVRCWTNVRNSAVLIVFNPQFALIKALASHICPEVHVITPRVLLANFVQKAMGVFLRRYIFPPLYYRSLRWRPDAIYIYDIGAGDGWPYVKHLDPVYKKHAKDTPFWDAYVEARGVIDRRFDVYEDFLHLTRTSEGIHCDQVLVRGLMADLEISGKYVVVNINVKDYSNQIQNIRRIAHFERYNVLIDHLIRLGYSVVLQGTAEQPHFAPRKGFVDYAHSKFQSVENDLRLFAGCYFYVSSKTGAETYGILYDKPILGLNYTELCAMKSSIRFRFFPKRIKDGRGRLMSWRDVLAHPVYFQIGRILPTPEKVEFVEMDEQEIISAVDEFLLLMPKPREEWLNYSIQQREFKQLLHPGHMDLYHISAVPSDVYLKEDVIEGHLSI